MARSHGRGPGTVGLHLSFHFMHNKTITYTAVRRGMGRTQGLSLRCTLLHGGYMASTISGSPTWRGMAWAGSPQ